MNVNTVVHKIGGRALGLSLLLGAQLVAESALALDPCLSYGRRLALAQSPKVLGAKLEGSYIVSASLYGVHVQTLELMYPNIFKFYQDLGFAFPLRLSLSSMTYHQLERNYNKILADLVRQGVVKPHQTIRPGALHKKPDGSKALVRFNDEAYANPPKSEAKSDYERGDFHTIHEELMSVADGYFPMGIEDFLGHDIAHLATYVQVPQYMATFRDMARRYKNKEFPSIYIAGNENSDAVKAFKTRYFAVNEALVLFKPKAHAQVLKDLCLEIEPWDLEKDPDVISKVKAFVEEKVSKDKKWADSQISKLVRYYEENSRRVGGAVADGFNLAGKIELYSYYEESLFGTSPALTLEHLSFFRDQMGSGKKADLLTKLYTWAIVGHSQPKPESWVEWIFDPSGSPRIQTLLKANALLGDHEF